MKIIALFLMVSVMMGVSDCEERDIGEGTVVDFESEPREIPDEETHSSNDENDDRSDDNNTSAQ